MIRGGLGIFVLGILCAYHLYFLARRFGRMVGDLIGMGGMLPDIHTLLLMYESLVEMAFDCCISLLPCRRNSRRLLFYM
jgi:ABC-type lipoprotein release transport system permease subunit